MDQYRSEIKFICYQHNYYLIKNWIRLHAYNFFKEYEDRYINNIYFDSHDYKAFNDKIPIHVWVDETRPRNQGSFLTSWELGEHGVSHTVIADNTGGHLMQNGQVDIVIVGSDRTTFTGDVCNKIGTYLKALSAYDNKIPFYAALPSSTIDWDIEDGKNIPIEERNNEEVSMIRGKNKIGIIEEIQIVPDNTNVKNYAFDVTPSKFVTGIITERGVCAASKASIANLFPEKV